MCMVRLLRKQRLVYLKHLQGYEVLGGNLIQRSVSFFQTKVRHLRHIVSEDGILLDPKKTSALTSWRVPRTIKDLKQFLGFTGYFRSFVEQYSLIVKPLHELTSGYFPPKTLWKLKGKGRDWKGTLTLSSNITHLWSEQCPEAFNTTIEKLTSPPVLGFADLLSPFILYTDASNIGLGACLYQKQNGKLRVIS